MELNKIIVQVDGVHRKYRAANISLQMLKGIHDLHSQGIPGIFPQNFIPILSGHS